MLVQDETRCRWFCRASTSGFSYLEVLISFTLISSTLLAFLHMMWSQAAILFYSEQNRAAHILAQETIQRLKVNSNYIEREQANSIYFTISKSFSDDCDRNEEHICYQGACNQGQLALLDVIELNCQALRHKLELNMIWQTSPNAVLVRVEPNTCKSNSCFDASMFYQLEPR